MDRTSREPRGPPRRRGLGACGGSGAGACGPQLRPTCRPCTPTDLSPLHLQIPLGPGRLSVLPMKPTTIGSRVTPTRSPYRVKMRPGQWHDQQAAKFVSPSPAKSGRTPLRARASDPQWGEGVAMTLANARAHANRMSTVRSLRSVFDSGRNRSPFGAKRRGTRNHGSCTCRGWHRNDEKSRFRPPEMRSQDCGRVISRA